MLGEFQLDRKKVTFLIVSNRSGKTKRFIVSEAWLKAGIFAAIVAAIIFASGMVDYFGLLVQAIENKRLKVENVQMKQQFQVVESKLNSLEKGLERVKSFSQKLRLITNIDDDERVLKLTVGAGPKPGQNTDEMSEAVGDRPSSSKMANKDTGFFVDSPINEEEGELAVENQRDYATLVVRIDKAIKESQLREQSVLDLWELLSERQSLINAIPSIKPARGWYTSRFGYRVSPFTGRSQMHQGLDVAASPGSPVFAPADGIVTFTGYDDSYGKLVSIDHGYGLLTRYGHNSQIYVHVGQKVSRWDVIAAVGNTGRSTGPHLHYEVRVNGIPVDPANYILSE